MMLDLPQSRHKTRHLASADDAFIGDMIDLFAGIRGGHIARHGYVGKGGTYYDRWLATHDVYRKKVTEKELELIASATPQLAELCGDTVNFVEAGFGSPSAFTQKTLPLLAHILRRRGAAPRYTVADVNAASFAMAQDYFRQMRLAFPLDYIHGNFFEDIPVLEKNSAIYCAGLTFTNIPVDAIHNRTADILINALTRFARALKNGGVLMFSYATDTGGDDVKALYDHPMIYAYQLSIYERVASELNVSSGYDPHGFGTALEHRWHADNHVLTRHATVTRRMRFNIGGYDFDLQAGRDLYMANNFRFPDDMVRESATRAGFADCRIFALPDSGMRFAALITA